MAEAIGQLDSDEGTDRALIVERIHRYGWAYDERQRAQLADCFVEDAVWEGSIMGQTPVGPFRGRAAITEFLAGFWTAQTDQRRHIFTNAVITSYSSAEAGLFTYLLLTSASNGVMRVITTGPYRLKMSKDNAGVWRIARLVGGWDVPFN